MKTCEFQLYCLKLQFQFFFFKSEIYTHTLRIQVIPKSQNFAENFILQRFKSFLVTHSFCLLIMSFKRLFWQAIASRTFLCSCNQASSNPPKKITINEIENPSWANMAITKLRTQAMHDWWNRAPPHHLRNSYSKIYSKIQNIIFFGNTKENLLLLIVDLNYFFYKSSVIDSCI